MIKKTIYWITFRRPGSFVAEDWNVPCDEGTMAGDVEWPESAYSFSLHKREDISDDGELYRGKPEKIGPTYFHPDSKVESLEEVKKNPDATPTLIRNMEGNEWDFIVWSRWGNYPQPFDPNTAAICPKPREVTVPACSVCLSTDVLCDAYARWDAEAGAWVLENTFPDYMCGNCDGACSIAWVAPDKTRKED